MFQWLSKASWRRTDILKDDRYLDRPRRQQVVLSVLSVISLVTSSLVILAVLIQTPKAKNTFLRGSVLGSHESTEGKLKDHCGSSIDESIANGCIFDESLNGWVPPLCYNHTLAEEFLRNDTKLALVGGAGPFPWYRDENHERLIDPGQLPAFLKDTEHNMTAYTMEKWHVSHCLYVWRLGSNALAQLQNGVDDVYVNIRAIDPEHIRHCGHVIANQDHRVGARAAVEFGFGECVRLRKT